MVQDSIPECQDLQTNKEIVLHDKLVSYRGVDTE